MIGALFLDAGGAGKLRRQRAGARPPDAGQARVGGAVQRHARQAGGGGQVGQAGVDGDETVPGQHPVGERGQRQARQHLDAGQILRDALGAGALGVVAARQPHPLAGGGGPFRQGAPVGFGVVLGGPGGAVAEHQLGAGPGQRARRAGAAQTVIGGAVRGGVAEGGGEQLPHPGHRVAAQGHRQRPVQRQRRPGLAGGRFIQTELGAARQTGDKGAFDQALGVDHGVVLAFAQGVLEGGPLAAATGAPGVPAPAAQGTGQHPLHRRVAAGQVGEALFHHPVQPQARGRPRRVGDRRQGVDHITHGGGFDQQNTHTARPSWFIAARPATLPGPESPGPAPVGEDN